MRVLLDSNAYSNLKRGHHRITDIVRNSEAVLLPLVVIGELLYGFRNGSRPDRNAHELHAFLDNPHVSIAAMSLTTADRYARIAAALRAKGRPIPTNDIGSRRTPCRPVPTSSPATDTSTVSTDSRGYTCPWSRSSAARTRFERDGRTVSSPAPEGDRTISQDTRTSA